MSLLLSQNNDFYQTLLFNPQSLSQSQFENKFKQICKTSYSSIDMNEIIDEIQEQMNLLQKIKNIKFVYIRETTACNSNIDRFNKIFKNETYISIEKMINKIIFLSELKTSCSLSFYYFKATRFWNPQLNLVSSTDTDAKDNGYHEHGYLIMKSNFENVPLLLYPCEINGEFYQTTIS